MVRLSEIILNLKPDSFVGDEACTIDEVVSILNDTLHTNALSWCGDKYVEQLEMVNTGTVIVSSALYNNVGKSHPFHNQINWILTPNPRSYFAATLKAFFVKNVTWGTIASSVSIHETVQVDSSAVSIGENVVIEENCTIGKHVSIGHNAVIKSGTVIKDNVSIGCNGTIGGVGFGYEPDSSGNYEVIPHVGNVVLEEQVEIGNNVCIDRAVIGSTKLSKNVKVDNLVHIAHGVQIGENSLIIAKAMIAGSVTIGKNVWVAPLASIIQKVKIGDGAMIGMGSTVTKDVEPNTVVAGTPARKIRDR
jgi:UDP-3-O-[3-hydroxymyristoyl] glucosamine N-acyltransferase